MISHIHEFFYFDGLNIGWNFYRNKKNLKISKNKLSQKNINYLNFKSKFKSMNILTCNHSNIVLINNKKCNYIKSIIFYQSRKIEENHHSKEPMILYFPKINASKFESMQSYCTLFLKFFIPRHYFLQFESLLQFFFNSFVLY